MLKSFGKTVVFGLLISMGVLVILATGLLGLLIGLHEPWFDMAFKVFDSDHQVS